MLQNSNFRPFRSAVGTVQIKFVTAAQQHLRIVQPCEILNPDRELAHKLGLKAVLYLKGSKFKKDTRFPKSLSPQ